MVVFRGCSCGSALVKVTVNVSEVDSSTGRHILLEVVLSGKQCGIIVCKVDIVAQDFLSMSSSGRVNIVGYKVTFADEYT